MGLRLIRSAAVVACLALAACGGGGGGVASTPAPPTGGGGGGGSTPAPAPTNTAITDLRATQTFASSATTTNVGLAVPSGVVSASAGARDAIQVTYDAASRSYTVATAGRTQSFGVSDIQAARTEGETRYQRGREYLTLVTTPYYASTASNRYVGMGYWQSNEVSAGQQTTQFSTFAYGLSTPDAAVPRTGAASWKTDIFGMLTKPGQQLRTIQGSGGFEVDFAVGVFSAFANVDEFDYITGGGRVGSLPVDASGRLTSGNGFTGDLSYGGSDNTGPVAGTIAGQFYGPGAEEIGASFVATGRGGVLTGAMTGQRGETGTGRSTSLLDIRSTQAYFGTLANFFTQALDGGSGFRDVKAFVGNTGSVTVTPQGPGQAGVNSYGYTPAAAERVDDGRVNFATYRSVIAGTPVEVAYYRVGGGNTELQLTYLSFATWSQTARDAFPGGAVTNTNRWYIPYGIATPRGLLAARTGTASYAGVVYASGASRTGATYEVGGASQFAVDFSNSRYSGSLALIGQAQGGGSRDFGPFSFNGLMNEGGLIETGIDNGGFASKIAPVFYGPGGQEIGGSFALTTGTFGDPNAVQITGVAVAKQR